MDDPQVFPPSTPAAEGVEPISNPGLTTPELFTDAQLRRNRRKRWIRMKKLIRLGKKIESKMHN